MLNDKVNLICEDIENLYAEDASNEEMRIALMKIKQNIESKLKELKEIQEAENV